MSNSDQVYQINLHTLLKQVLIAIRGAWTQEEMSEKLGYSALQVHRWENQKISLSWRDFVRICKLRRAPIETAFEKFYAYRGDIADGETLLQMLHAKLSQKEIAARTGIKSTRLSKLFNGRQEPEAIEIFQIMYACQSWFWEFWSEVVKPEKAPLIKSEIEKRKRQISVSLQFPFSAAILEILNLKKYQNSDIETASYLSQELQIHISDIKKALIALIDANLITKLADGKYSQNKSHVNLGGDFLAAKVVMEYWMQKQLTLLKQTRKKFPESFFSYMTVPLSNESLVEVRQLFLELYQKIVFISESDLKENKNIYTYTLGFVKTSEKPIN